MMYPFMTLDDNTEIVHSEMQPDHRVKVYIEKPDEKDCFHSAVCYLPDYTGRMSAASPLLRSTATRSSWNPLHIPPRVLRNIMAIIEARSDEVIAKWMNFFGEVRYFC